MCGIVGLIARRQSGFFHGDVDLFQNLLLLDTLRGDDSTGVFTVMKDRRVIINKIGSHPLHMFSTAAWTKFRNQSAQSGRIIIGHNRKATTGIVNSENAHPFHENNIVLVHNGTLHGDHKKMADTEVDSHAICHAINEKGAEDVLSTLDAAFALVWWDIQKNKLYAVRNDERPLNIVVTDDYYVLCSEAWMAQAMLSRANPAKKIEKVIPLEPGMLVEFDLDGTFSMKKIELKKYTVVQQVSYSPWNNQQDRDYIRRTFQDMEDADWTDPNEVPLVGVIKPSPVNDCTPFHSAADRLVAQSAMNRNSDYEKGEQILVKFHTAQQDATGGNKHKLTGTCMQPGKPTIDVVGYVLSGEQRQYMGVFCLATIVGFARSNCGPSAFVGRIELAPMKKTHTMDVPEVAWNYVVKSVHCKDCGNGIHDCEAEFTGVSLRSTAEYRVTCADCVEHKLPTGEIKDAFTQRRLDALQNGVAISPKPTSGTLSLVKSESGPTIH